MANYGYLAPLSQKQIRKRVPSQINPYLASGERAITDYTNALAQALDTSSRLGISRRLTRG